MAQHIHVFRTLMQELHVFGWSVTFGSNTNEVRYALVKLWEVVEVFIYTPEHKSM